MSQVWRFSKPVGLVTLARRGNCQICVVQGCQAWWVVAQAWRYDKGPLWPVVRAKQVTSPLVTGRAAHEACGRTVVTFGCRDVCEIWSGQLGPRDRGAAAIASRFQRQGETGRRTAM